MGLSVTHASLEGAHTHRRARIIIVPDAALVDIVVRATRRHRALCARSRCVGASRLTARAYIAKDGAAWGHASRTVCARCGRLCSASWEPLVRVMREATFTIDDATGRILNITSREVPR